MAPEYLLLDEEKMYKENKILLLQRDGWRFVSIKDKRTVDVFESEKNAIALADFVSFEAFLFFAKKIKTGLTFKSNGVLLLMASAIKQLINLASDVPSERCLKFSLITEQNHNRL